jgi:hypothetical protein
LGSEVGFGGFGWLLAGYFGPRLFLSSLVVPGHVTSSSVVLGSLFLLRRLGGGGIVVNFSIIVLVPSGEVVVSLCLLDCLLLVDAMHHGACMGSVVGTAAKINQIIMRISSQ